MKQVAYENYRSNFFLVSHRYHSIFGGHTADRFSEYEEHRPMVDGRPSRRTGRILWNSEEM